MNIKYTLAFSLSAAFSDAREVSFDTHCERIFRNCDNIQGLETALESFECIKYLADQLEERGYTAAGYDCPCNMKKAVREELQRTKLDFKYADADLDNVIAEVRLLRHSLKNSWIKSQKDLERLDDAVKQEGELFGEMSKLRWKQSKLEDLEDYYKKQCQ